MKRLIYLSNHRTILRRALIRLKELKTTDKLPAPYRRATGVLGKSTVYFLYIPRGTGGHNLVAKFDEPDRQKKEWSHIETLRRLDTPPSALLPLNNNSRQDGVIIYRAAGGHGRQARWIELKELLTQQHKVAPQNCIDALTLTFDALAPFYESEPGKAHISSRNVILHWHNVFPVFRNTKVIDELYAGARKVWPQVNWRSDRDFSPFPADISAQPITVPNPLLRLKDCLDQLTSRVMLSRIHGDLNLSNIVIGQSQLRVPESAYIIDLSHCESDKLTALDFARVEVSLFLDIFATNESDSSAFLSNIVHLRDYADGRELSLVPDLEACMQLVKTIRARAIETLSPGGRSQNLYSMEDYFNCLYFHALRALAYPKVKRSINAAKATLLIAALSSQFLTDLNAGRYSDGQLNGLYLNSRLPTIKKGLRIAIGVVTRNNDVLLVKRRIPEGKLIWQFPAGVVKPSEAADVAICDEIKAETGVSVKVVSHLGNRIHPDTNLECDYYHCIYLHGKLNNADLAENSDVRWVAISNAHVYFTSDLFDPIKGLFSTLMKNDR
jgi:ADP-ribose pyrophosphatase YjhB (NUDIX family)